MQIDRAELSKAIAKAIAYKQCGKHVDAAKWGLVVVHLLKQAHILEEGDE
jgi:hypothetical protein